jgi:hypothetical protein
MKKLKVLKLAFLSCAGYLIICAYHNGPAANGYDCTGAETGLGNPTGCTGGGCHAKSATAGITVSIQLDSAGGKSTNYYVGGGKYTIKITGTNTTSSTLPDFGFQLGVITGTTAVTTPTNAGSFPSPYPTNTHYSGPSSGNYVVGVVEQSTQLKATSGTGGNGTTYVETINWTAPAKGTGSCSIWAAINAVNDNGNADAGDLWNLNHMTITEIIPSTTGVDNISVNDEMRVYPNPVSEHVTFALPTETENVTVALYDITGRLAKQVTFSGKEVTIEKGDMANGIYIYTVTSEGQNLKTGKIIVQ